MQHSPVSKLHADALPVDDLMDIERLEEGECELLDDLMVHFEGDTWRAPGDLD